MKANKDFTIISLPDATMDDLAKFKERFDELRKQPDFSPIFTNVNTKIFKIKKGEIFEIVTSEKKIGSVA